MLLLSAPVVKSIIIMQDRWICLGKDIRIAGKYGAQKE